MYQPRALSLNQMAKLVIRLCFFVTNVAACAVVATTVAAVGISLCGTECETTKMATCGLHVLMV